MSADTQPPVVDIARKAAMTWITGPDTGASSKTIWAVMLRAVHPNGRYDRPYDGHDFGRCLRLLQAVPEWRSRLDEVAAHFPKWGPLVCKWSLLENAYAADQIDNGSRTSAALRDLSEEWQRAIRLRTSGGT